MLDVMRKDGYHVKTPPKSWEPPEWKSKPAPAPAPPPPPAPEPSESGFDGGHRSLRGSSDADSWKAPPPMPPAPEDDDAAMMDVLRSHHVAHSSEHGSFEHSSFEDHSFSESPSPSFSESPSPSFSPSSFSSSGHLRPPPAPMDDDDALLDVMRKDGYHVNKPAHPFLLQRTVRTVAQGGGSMTLESNSPREDAALVDAAVAFLRADMGEQGATGKLIKRIAAQGRADDAAMLARLRDRLQSEVDACNPQTRATEVQKSQAEVVATQHRVDLLRAELGVVKSLEGDVQRAAENGRQLRGRFAGLLGDDMRHAYEDALDELQKASKCPPPQVGAELLSALTQLLSRDFAAAKQREAGWRSGALDAEGERQQLTRSSGAKLVELQQQQHQLAAAQLRTATLKRKMAAVPTRSPQRCTDLTKHTDLLDAIKRSIRILQS